MQGASPYISPALVCTTQGHTQGAYSHHSLLLQGSQRNNARRSQVPQPDGLILAE